MKPADLQGERRLMGAVSSPVAALLPRQQPERGFVLPAALTPPGSGRIGSPSEILAAEKVHVAVGREVKEGRPILLRALRNTPRDKGLVLVLLFQPASRIRLMGAMIPVDRLKEQEVRLYRQLEREKMKEALAEYQNICAAEKVQAEVLVVENDDVAKGLIELIDGHRITKLVMGTAAHKHYLPWGKMTHMSKTAITVEQKTDKTCEILFVHKGSQICTRSINMVENYKNQHEQILNESRQADEQQSTLELQITHLEHTVKDFEAKLSDAYSLIKTLEQKCGELQCQRDNAVKEAEELRQRKEGPDLSSGGAVNYSDFTYSELQEATNNFAESQKIGEGGYGSVYKGFLRHTPVAIKRLNPQSTQGEVEFNQEVNILSRVRHPNLVNLIGACQENRALVYELLSRGSLEDRLQCKDQSQPLSWWTRVCIGSEVCCALIFLHSHKPKCIVHGDLKPANILLDANYVSKLGDFGICRVLNQSNTTKTPYIYTDNPKGTVAYMDPEYLSSGELTPFCDVYSFGIVLLRLLTGKPPFRIKNEVQEAFDKECFHEVLDGSAGEWPFEQAKQLASMALRCCGYARKKRPYLKEVWDLLDSMMKMASSQGRSSSPSPFSSELDVSHYILPASFVL